MRVVSEIGTLRTVLLHRPGCELESLTPQYLDSMLFEDIPFLDGIRAEHDDFAALLRAQGCEVLYVDQLLHEVVRNNRTAADSLIDETVSGSGIPDEKLRSLLTEYLRGKDSVSLVQSLIGGIRKEELASALPGGRRGLSDYIRDEYPFYISPLPNLYFTRDPAAVLGTRCSINLMKTPARRRESLLVKTGLLDYLGKNGLTPAQAAGALLADYTGGSSIEGGDMLVLDPETVAIGCSARTETWAIEKLAEKILISEEAREGTGREVRHWSFKRMLVVQIPFTRAYMHLDTVFTMVDRDKFTIFPGVEPHVRCFVLTLGKHGNLQVHPEPGLEKALKKVLKLPAVDLIKTGGGDRITAAREQWNDSTNTLAVSPGVVVTYRRNVVSNDTLEKHGITVLSIRGSELVRGRGGPRCMSMPLLRDDVS